MSRRYGSLRQAWSHHAIMAALALLVVFSASGCTTGGNAGLFGAMGKQMDQDGYTASHSEATASQSMPAKAHLCLYHPDKAGKYLSALEKTAVINRSIEQTIMEELLSDFGMSGVRVVSVIGKGGRLNVTFSGSFADAMRQLGARRSIVAYALVDSITELPGIMEVVFSVESSGLQTMAAFRSWHPSAVREAAVWNSQNAMDPLSGITVKNSSGKTQTLAGIFHRDRGWFNRNRKLNPAEVMGLEMTLEQQGKWLNAYLLMSDDQGNRYRKYYDEFYKELVEMKANGFLYTQFRINGYKIDKTGDKAQVEVEFINRINTSYSQHVDKMWFHTVKIEGIWMVDWLTAQ